MRVGHGRGRRAWARRFVQALYADLRLQYPDATVWFTGHSLGGALASLLALEAGSAAFCYEAPGETLYAERLGFKLDRKDMGQYRTCFLSARPHRAATLTRHRNLPPTSCGPWTSPAIYHFGNTADPIFTGECNGPASTCFLTGYAMETTCHVGQRCVYTNNAIHRYRPRRGRRVGVLRA